MSNKSKPLQYYISKKTDLEGIFKNDQRNSRKERSIITKPFSKSIRTKKDTSTYNAHSYPTKVPPEGIVPFLEHYTTDGDVILDPFCGSGMTGVATRLLTTQTNQRRSVILNDLGTAATHISFNYNNGIDLAEFQRQVGLLDSELSQFRSEMYQTFHCVTPQLIDVSNLSIDRILRAQPNQKDGIRSINFKGKTLELVNAEIVNAIWSEINICTKCDAEINLWKVAMNAKTGKMAKSFECENCKTPHTRADFAKPHRHQLAYVIYEYTCPKTKRTRRSEREAARFDQEILEVISRKQKTNWHPAHPISPNREMMTMGPAKLGVKTIADFYTKRNLLVCAKIWDFIGAITCKRTRSALMFAATNTFWHATKMRRFNVKGGMRPLTGTLYIPQISAECNVFRVLEKKINELVDFYSNEMFSETLSSKKLESFQVNESATNLTSIPSGSIDYIFTDPPFGGNIYYSDCNVIWEGWLDQLTDDQNEILFNRSRKPKDGGKTRQQYHSLMDAAFREMYRVLKAGKWASIVFNNSDNEILAGFVDSARKAGFEVREVTFFDKDQKSVKGYMGQKGTQNVTNLDIVLTVQKPLKAKSLATNERKSVSDEKVFRVISDYLKKLPSRLTEKDGVYTDEHRTSPFLHSMLLRHFIKNNFDLNELTISRLNQVCSNYGLEYQNGKWFLESQIELAA